MKKLFMQVVTDTETTMNYVAEGNELQLLEAIDILVSTTEASAVTYVKHKYPGYKTMGVYENAECQMTFLAK